MARRAPERVLDADWGEAGSGPKAAGRSSTQVYPVDVVLRARDRQGLLRDISDVFARDRLNVIGVHTVSRDAQAQMRFTVEVPNIAALNRTLAAVEQIDGVLQCRRV
jgi:GTP pyrophosphokinase